ncbi:hypothetical protein TNCV_3817461 [Trichonephila clavipes]|nr:hypothetical protein TNCV_3817461 [Trichonephila clavipes]
MERSSDLLPALQCPRNRPLQLRCFTGLGKHRTERSCIQLCLCKRQRDCCEAYHQIPMDISRIEKIPFGLFGFRHGMATKLPLMFQRFILSFLLGLGFVPNTRCPDLNYPRVMAYYYQTTHQNVTN